MLLDESFMYAKIEASVSCLQEGFPIGLGTLTLSFRGREYVLDAVSTQYSNSEGVLLFTTELEVDKEEVESSYDLLESDLDSCRAVLSLLGTDSSEEHKFLGGKVFIETESEDYSINLSVEWV